ncbi:Replicative DNA helicase [Candidatus Vidania fulgoroideae]|nr:Replicative DNA helicase [Candidatus Vidania fulgoroideae]
MKKKNESFFSLEAERSLLSCLIKNNEIFKKVKETVSHEDFFLKENRLLFKVINRIFLNSKEINPVNIKNFLERKKDKVLGSEYLEKIYSFDFKKSNFKKYIKILKKKRKLRFFFFSFQKILEDIKKGEITKIDEVVFLSKENISKIKEKEIKNKNKTIFNTKKILGNILCKKKEKYYKTGFKPLDKLILGLKPGEISIIAGRPSTGKTSFCMSIAEYIAFKKKKSVLFFSLEMTIKQLIIRLLSSISKINSYKILNNLLNQKETIDIIKACKTIKKSNIFINDNPYIDILDICSEIKKNIPKKGVVFIDYIQLINIRKGRENRNLEITEISYHLKNISKSMNVPIVIISQLNRGVELRLDKTPIMSDLRESGSLEQDADLIIFLSKNNAYEDPNFSMINFTIGKNRNGPLGSFELMFNKSFTKFVNE